MYYVNRGVLIVKAKQPFLDWVRNLPGPDHEATLEQLRKDSLAVLVPEKDSDPDGEEFVASNYEWMFEEGLESWWTDEDDWPKKRDLKTFLKWFDVEFHSVVVEPSGKPIRREEF